MQAILTVIETKEFKSHWVWEAWRKVFGNMRMAVVLTLNTQVVPSHNFTKGLCPSRERTEF